MKRIYRVLIVLAFALPAFGQGNAANDPSITEFDVNGLKVIFKKRSSSPTVSLGLFVRGGTRNQSADTAGIENLTLRTAVESSKKFPREVLRRELARTGTTLGGGSGYDFGAFSMASTSSNFARSWEIFVDVVTQPTFDADDVERVRNAVLVGLRNASVSPDSALDSLEEKVVYAGHPYSVDPGGTVETVSKLTPADLKAYHARLMQTSRLLLVVVGDVDADAFRGQVAAAFSNMPRGDYRDTPMPKLKFPAPSLDIVQRNIGTNYIKGVFAAPSPSEPDYAAMQVAMSILQSRVYFEVRSRRNLSYAPNAEMNDRAANSAEIYVTAVDANRSVGVMLAEIESMRSQEMDPDDFAGIPAFFLKNYYLDQETNASQVGELGKYELIGGGWRNSLSFLEKIRAVKPADVKAAAVKYMIDLRFVVVGDPSAIDRDLFLRK